MSYRLTVRVRADLKQILRYSIKTHGEDAAGRYRVLLTTAFEDLGRQPDRPGSRPVARRPGILVYALAHSRARTPVAHRVKQPAHQIIYRVAEDGAVDILAVTGESYPASRIDISSDG